MSIVSDTVPCPQCQASAEQEFQTRDGSTTVYCLTCGYHDRDGQVEPGHGTVTLRLTHLTQVMPLSSPLDDQAFGEYVQSLQHDPEVQAIYCCRPPHFRREYRRGEPPRTTSLPLSTDRLLADYFADQGEHLHSTALRHGHGEAFTEKEGVRGLKAWSLWQEGHTLSLAEPGDSPTLALLQHGQLFTAAHVAPLTREGERPFVGDLAEFTHSSDAGTPPQTASGTVAAANNAPQEGPEDLPF